MEMYRTMGIKNKLRNIAVKTPYFIHRAATEAEIARITRHLMKEDEVVESEKSEAYKKQCVAAYMKRFPSVTKELNSRITRFVDNNCRFDNMDSREKRKMITDMMFCHFAYGTQIDEYIFMDFWGTLKNSDERREVVSDTEQHIVRLCANDLTHAELSDKASAYLKLKKYYKRDILIVDKNTSFEEFEEFAARNQKYVVKKVNMSRGKGVELDHAGNDLKRTFENYLKFGKVLLEEVIEQTDDVAIFNTDSVNTARISTFLTKKGPVAPWGFFRTGRKGSFIDNCAAGGVFASIDTKAGVLSSNGCDESGNRYDKHPDSQIQLKGFKLPDWDQAIALCKEAALVTPDIKYISWDLAHSKKYGWVIVEVNTCGQFLQQVGPLKGIKSELREILNNMDLVVPYRFIRN